MADASPGLRERPLSPHVQVWRWHVTMAASIFNRATGVALYAGWLIFAGWALALAGGPDAYGAYCSVLTSIPGQIVLFGIAVSLFFHLAAGVRHLFWDSGRGFVPRDASASAIAAFVFAAAAAVVLFVVAHLGQGSAS
ncbi:MAG TPA: succinate dehydrogenase, cytochrome b556 subunit [Caulobacteraceae bacterium]|jgi:succinate dehydrogenase / fumarate reductase cytochrome b subunit|nr:succinate dehydrogenase, cytochrome b556 subunit [Caulobacteraceae bacterium]